jgi:hypothetical protein
MACSRTTPVAALALGVLTMVTALALSVGRAIEQGRAFTNPNDPDGHVQVSTLAPVLACGTYVRGAQSSGQSTNPTGYDWIEPGPLSIAAVECPRFRGHLSAWSAVSDLAGRIGVHVQHPVSPSLPRAVPG